MVWPIIFAKSIETVKTNNKIQKQEIVQKGGRDSVRVLWT